MKNLNSKILGGFSIKCCHLQLSLKCILKAYNVQYPLCKLQNIYYKYENWKLAIVVVFPLISFIFEYPVVSGQAFCHGCCCRKWSTIQMLCNLENLTSPLYNPKSSGTLLHCLWSCPRIFKFWEEVIQTISSISLPVCPRVFILGLLPPTLRLLGANKR